MKSKILAVMAFCLMFVVFLSPVRGSGTSVDSIEVAPISPEDWDDIVCTTVVSDTGGNLDKVRFTWYRNSVGIRQREVTVSGFSETESDTLDDSFTEEGDEIRCKVEVWDPWSCYDYGDVTVFVGETSENNPPVIAGIPDQITEIGEEVMIDLWDYASDIEDSDSELDFSFDESGNPDIVECDIQGGRYVSCDEAKQLGETALTVRVTDTESAWDTDTFVIEVEGDCPWCDNEPPQIEHIDIEPSHPDEGDDLTCEVEVEDEDGNLDSIEFRWYVNGDLERTRIRGVSGYHDTSEDELDSDEFDDGDDVECRVTVEDKEGEDDTASDEVEIEENGGDCRIDVYDLEVEDEEDIEFKIRNRGDDDVEVEYKIYVNGKRVERDDVDIDEGDTESISYEYDDFEDDEDYEIRVWAKADCGDSDEEEVDYTILGSCNIHILDLRVQYDDEVTFRLVNTGNDDQEIEYRIYIDGDRVEEDDIEVDDGDSETIRFRYSFIDGREYEVRVWAIAECGRTDSDTITYWGGEAPPGPSPGPSPGICNYNMICESGEDWHNCPYDCPEPRETAPTDVTISPGSMDVNLYKSKVISVRIHSAVKQDFMISVEGVPEDWLDYKPVINVDGDKTAYVFVNPKEKGNHIIVVRAEAVTEGLTFTDSVDLFVAEQDRVPSGDGISGAIVGFFSNIYTIIVILIIVAAVLLWLAMTYLKPEEEITFEQR